MSMAGTSGAHHSPTFDRDALLPLPEPAGSASISPSARDIVLVSRSGLRLVDLDLPHAEPRFIPYHVPTGVVDIQWSPHAFRDSWIVSTAGPNAILWDVAHSPAKMPILEELRGHSRSITDINFSAHHPELLATCSVDSFVFLWDVRTPGRPVTKLADWHESSSQVKFNRQDEHILASAHGGHFNVWDDRKGAVPLKTIEAHSTKIYGIDWHREYKENILTCSLDKTIKLWNWARAGDSAGDNHGDPIDRVIRTGYPVWRARYTPFGHGILAMPQRGDNSLHMYDSRTYRLADRDSSMTPVESFTGHQGPVKEFLWRHRGGVEDGRDMRDFQLVSFSTDQTIRLHRLSADTLKRVGYRKGDDFESPLRFTRKHAVYRSFVLHDKQKHEQQFAGYSTSSMTDERSYSDFPPLVEQKPMRRRSYVISRDKSLNNGDIRTGDDESSILQAESDSTLSHRNGSSLESRETASPPIDLHDKVGRPINADADGEGGRRSAPSRFSSTLQGSESFTSRSDSFLRRGSDAAISGLGTSPKGVQARESAVVTESEDELEALDVFDEEEDDEDDAVIGALIRTSRPPRNVSSDHLHRAINAKIPPPRTCTARWCPNGSLVCLFPAKHDRSHADLPPKVPDFRGIADFFSSASQRQRANSSDQDSLSTTSSASDILAEDGNGILHASSMRFESPRFLRRDETHSEQHMAEPDEARSSLEAAQPSSVNDSVTSPVDAQRSRASASFGTSGSLPRTNHAKYLSFTSESSGKVVARTRRPPKPSSAISIRDLVGLLPSKKYLARDYILVGDASDICRHNAQVCKRHGMDDHARVWQDSAHLLHPAVPLRSVHGSKHLLVPARRNVVEIARRNRAGRRDQILAYDDPNEVTHPARRAAVQWRRGHPLGARMANKMLNHFEESGDEQMLAMLAFVFGMTASGYQEAAKQDASIQESSSGTEAGEDEGIGMIRPRKERSGGRRMDDEGLAIRWKNEHRFNEGLRKSSHHPSSPALTQQYCAWRERYAEILYSWGLYEARAQMLKANGSWAIGGGELSVTLDTDGIAAPMSECSICGARIQGGAKYCGNGAHSMHEACFELFAEHEGLPLDEECPFGCDSHSLGL